MTSRTHGGRARAAALVIAVCALAAAAPAGAVSLDPQGLADSLGVPHVPGVPNLPPANVPVPPSPVQAPAAPAGVNVPGAPGATPTTGTAASTQPPQTSTATETPVSRRGSGPAPSSQPRSAGRRPASVRTTASPAPARRLASSAAANAHPTANVRAKSAGNPLDALGASLPLPAPLPDWSKPIIVALMLIALVLGLRSRVMARRARRLEAQRAALVQDVDAMQAALAPEVATRQGPLAVSVAYRPADGPAAGGDFYDVFGLDESRVAVMVGDVSGHGRAALARAAQTRFTLRAYLELGMPPRTALALAGGRASAEPGQFATVAVGVYEAASGTLTYATAGHPPPILLGAGAFEPIVACASVPLGWGVATGRRQTTVPLPTGAIACFYSDGLPEARARGELLGRARVVELLAGLGRSPDAASLLERLREVADEAPDDMAACLIRTSSGATDAVRLEEIELDPRQLGAGRGEQFLRACNVAPRHRNPALRRAEDMAGEFGAAVLRVTLAPRDRTVVVEPPRRHDATAPGLPDPLAVGGATGHAEPRVPAAAGYCFN